MQEDNPTSYSHLILFSCSFLCVVLALFLDPVDPTFTETSPSLIALTIYYTNNNSFDQRLQRELERKHVVLNNRLFESETAF